MVIVQMHTAIIKCLKNLEESHFLQLSCKRKVCNTIWRQCLECFKAIN